MPVLVRHKVTVAEAPASQSPAGWSPVMTLVRLAELLPLASTHLAPETTASHQVHQLGGEDGDLRPISQIRAKKAP